MCEGGNLKPIFVRLTNKQHQIMKQKSQQNQVSISSLIRLAVEDYIKEDNKI